MAYGCYQVVYVTRCVGSRDVEVRIVYAESKSEAWVYVQNKHNGAMALHIYPMMAEEILQWTTR